MRFTLKNPRSLQYIDYQNVRKTEFLGCQSQGGTVPLKMYLYDPQTKYNIEFHSTKFKVAVTTELVSALKLLGVQCSPVRK